jgi:hypothetical protein
MKRITGLTVALCVAAAVVPVVGAAAGPRENANCTAQIVVYDVIRAGAPKGASEDLGVMAQPPKDFPPLSNVGYFSRTNCA